MVSNFWITVARKRLSCLLFFVVLVAVTVIWSHIYLVSGNLFILSSIANETESNEVKQPSTFHQKYINTLIESDGRGDEDTNNKILQESDNGKTKQLGGEDKALEKQTLLQMNMREDKENSTKKNHSGSDNTPQESANIIHHNISTEDSESSKTDSEHKGKF